MIRDITIGQYYPADSVIHRLDPRVKLMGTIVFLISLFLFDHFVGYIIATLFLGCAIKMSKVPLKFMVKGLKAIFMLLAISVVFNLFLTDGVVVFQIWKIKVTQEGIRMAVFMAIRLVYLILGSSLMTLTTTPNDLTDGMEKAMSPLRKLRVPVHEISSYITEL